MNERLLQFIWQFQYFNQHELHSTGGEVLVIEKPGDWNHHQGPDFSEAIIKIGLTKWIGNIELHLKSSDWYKHHHSSDGNYSTIILHVVWEDDLPVYDRNENCLTTLILGNRVPKILLERYSQMMETEQMVACHSFLPVLNDLAWIAWKERLVVERLERKSVHILDLLKQTNQHWEEVLWCLLAANFGTKVNNDLFEFLAKSISINLLYKHKQQVHQIEAILMGQANLLLGVFKDDYPILLQREYSFLRKKYQLVPLNRKPAFLRMRPASFPTVRLAQLAMLLKNVTHLFAQIKEINELNEIMGLFNIKAVDYWDTHYQFDVVTEYMPKQIGKQMVENILINTVIPVLFSFGLYGNEPKYSEKAIQWLYQLSGEQNPLTRKWKILGISLKTALDSQALIELTNNYCITKRCLDCAIGNKILKT